MKAPSRMLWERILSLVLPRNRTVRSAATAKPGCAYVTLLTTESYLPGVLALEMSLRRSGSVYPLVVALGDRIGDGCERRLRDAGIETCRVVNPVTLDPELVALNESLGYGHWTLTYERLAFFSMTRWRKIVSIDSDMMVVRNTDPLFDWPHLASVAAGRHFPGNEHWSELNGGLIVIEPREGLTQRLAERVPTLFRTAMERGERAPIGDQQVFNIHFEGWRDTTELHLPQGYNVLVDHLDHYMKHVLSRDPEGKPMLSIVHYAGGRKPWQMSTGRMLRECYYHLRKGRPQAARYLLAYFALIRLALQEPDAYRAAARR